MKFHQNSVQDSLQFSFHVPQNSTHSSPSDTRCQNQNLLIPNRDSPNGYPTVRPAELQSVTLSHQVDSHKTLTTHKLACSCFIALFGHQ